MLQLILLGVVIAGAGYVAFRLVPPHIKLLG